MDIREETLVRVTGEQVVLRAAIKWLLSREAKRDGDLRAASEAISAALTDIPEAYRGTLQVSVDQLIAGALLEAQK